MRALNFIFLCSIILLIPVTLGFLIISIHYIYAQAGTPATITGNNLPSSIEFIPQKAIITTLPPDGNVANTPSYNTSDTGGGITGAIIGAIGLGTAIYTNITKGRNIKQLAAQDVTHSEVQLSQSKQFYEVNKEYGDNLNGKAPETKLQKLQENKDQAIKTASKV